MSAPLDLLSESLSSTSSLINQLMLKQHRDERALGGPMASALLGKQSGRFQPFRRRRQTTTASTTTAATEAEGPVSTRETLVYACPEPEGCPPPIRGQKYEPIKIAASAAKNANLEKPRDVLDTIYRQEVVKNNKKVMRVRKKQRKPSKPKKKKEKLEKEETPVITLKAVEMVSEMIKEAGPVLTQQEIEIIADVSQEVGAKVNEKQVKVISMLSEAMGPNLSQPEIKTIAEVASTLEEDSTLASDSTLKVVAEMIKSKVGQTMTQPQLEKIKDVMTQEPSEEEPVEEAKQSGLTDHGAEMVAQMMNNIGSDASAAEVQIVAEMIKELDKDVPKETAEVMAQVLQELMPVVTPELVHNVSAVLSGESAGNLVKEQIEMVAEVIKQSPPLTAEISPEVIELVAEMAVEEPEMSVGDVVKVIEQETNSVIEESDVQTIKEVAMAVMKENQVLEEADLEVISMMTKVAFNENADENNDVFKNELARRPTLTPINVRTHHKFSRILNFILVIFFERENFVFFDTNNSYNGILLSILILK